MKCTIRSRARLLATAAAVMCITIAGGANSAAQTEEQAAAPATTPAQASVPSEAQKPTKSPDQAPAQTGKAQGTDGTPGTEGQKTTEGEPAKDATKSNTGKVVGALVGAALGALIGRHGNAGKGAVIGAMAGLVAGAMFDKYTVQQTKTAAVVNDEYKKANAGALPTTTTVTKYATRTEPQSVVARGGAVQFISEIEIVRGTAAATQPDLIEQELILFDPSGQGEKRVRKPAVESATESGAYSTEFVFKPSQSTPQGQYPFKTVLYLNGKQVQESAGTIQIAAMGAHKATVRAA